MDVKVVRSGADFFAGLCGGISKAPVRVEFQICVSLPSGLIQKNLYSKIIYVFIIKCNKYVVVKNT